VLIPLVWAAFFALPFCGLINLIDKTLQQLVRQCRRRASSSDDGGINFKAVPGLPKIKLELSGDEQRRKLEGLIRRANTPCQYFETAPSWLTAFCRRRVEITKITPVGRGDDGLRKGWKYYIKKAEDDAELPDAFELCLHQDGRYKITPTSDCSGTIELNVTSAISWSISLVVTILVMFLSLWAFLWLTTLGARSFSAHFKDYQKGIQDFVTEIGTKFSKFLPPGSWEAMKQQVDNFVKNGLPTLVTGLAEQLEGVTWNALLFVIYLFFWVFEPLPVSAEVENIFRNYLLLKTVVCLLFATSMSLTLLFLSCPLWALFFVLTFVLNYIPEFGAILSAILTVPAVLFDGSVSDVGTRIKNVVWLAFLGALIKVITGNVIEVQLYATRGGEHMRMHPVILMAVMMICSAFLGITGMFLAVPLMAVSKFFMMSGSMPKAFRNPLLVLIEGDETAAYRNSVDHPDSEDSLRQDPHVGDHSFQGTEMTHGTSPGSRTSLLLPPHV